MACTIAALLGALYFLEPSLEPPPPLECPEGWTCPEEAKCPEGWSCGLVGWDAIDITDTTGVITLSEGTWEWQIGPTWTPFCDEDDLGCHERRVEEILKERKAAEERKAKLEEIGELVKACNAQ